MIIILSLKNQQMSLKDNLNALEKKKKYKAFSVLLKKKITKIDKDANESVETISYKIPFTDSMRFMRTSLSKLVDNLTEVIHVAKCKDFDFRLNMKVSRMI